MGFIKGSAKTALIVVAVLVVLHYFGPDMVKKHTGTV